MGSFQQNIEMDFKEHTFIVEYYMEGTQKSPYVDVKGIWLYSISKKDMMTNIIAGKEITNPYKEFYPIETRMRKLFPDSNFLQELYEEIDTACFESEAEDIETIGEEYDEGDKEEYYGKRN